MSKPTYEQLDEWCWEKHEALRRMLFHLERGQYYTLSNNIKEYEKALHLGVEETAYKMEEQDNERNDILR